jgi:hypothetical protein
MSRVVVAVLEGRAGSRLINESLVAVSRLLCGRAVTEVRRRR